MYRPLNIPGTAVVVGTIREIDFVLLFGYGIKANMNNYCCERQSTGKLTRCRGVSITKTFSCL